MVILEYVIKTVIFYILIIVMIRLLGKREVGEISVFDLVVLLIIADIATTAISRDWSHVLYSICSMLTLFVLQKFFAYITLKKPKLRKIIDYPYSIIIYDGFLNLEEMTKQAYTIDDLITQARISGVMDLAEIRLAILESSGQLSIYKKDEYDKIILPVIVSGVIQNDNLEFLKIDEEKIMKYIIENNLILEEINYLSSDGSRYFNMDFIKNTKSSLK